MSHRLSKKKNEIKTKFTITFNYPMAMNNKIVTEKSPNKYVQLSKVLSIFHQNRSSDLHFEYVFFQFEERIFFSNHLGMTQFVTINKHLESLR